MYEIKCIKMYISFNSIQALYQILSTPWLFPDPCQIVNSRKTAATFSHLTLWTEDLFWPCCQVSDWWSSGEKKRGTALLSFSLCESRLNSLIQVVSCSRRKIVLRGHRGIPVSYRLLEVNDRGYVSLGHDFWKEIGKFLQTSSLFLFLFLAGCPQFLMKWSQQSWWLVPMAFCVHNGKGNSAKHFQVLTWPVLSTEQFGTRN